MHHPIGWLQTHTSLSFSCCWDSDNPGTSLPSRCWAAATHPPPPVVQGSIGKPSTSQFQAFLSLTPQGIVLCFVQRKKDEQITLFSDHKGSFLRRQPGAVLLSVLMQGKRKSELLDKLLAMYPPVLHRWFLARFPEPATWHNARLGFTRTTAVWSMVGHIVGLGDRHGENILLDATTGDAVHVDFAFLFDRVSLQLGIKLLCMELLCPEIIPRHHPQKWQLSIV